MPCATEAFTGEKGRRRNCKGNELLESPVNPAVFATALVAHC